MCPLTDGKTASSLQAGHMADVVWEEIVSSAQGVDRFVIAGFGEPLLHPKCLDFLGELNELGVETSISTNGMVLTQPTVKTLAGLKHLSHVNVSVDSPDPGTYREIRGGKLEEAFKGIENLMSVIDDPARVTVSSVIMDSNADSLPAFALILSRMGVEKYIIQGLVDYNQDYHGEWLLDRQEKSDILAKIEQACSDARVGLFFTTQARLELELYNPPEALRQYYSQQSTPKDGTKGCCLPWEMPYIDKDGRVFPCCYAATKHTAVLGDLREDSLRSVWHGKEYQDFRRNILDGRTTPTVCQSCTVVPLGEHPFRLYSAQISCEQSLLSGRTRPRLVVRNTGTRSWTRDDRVFIGTANPRDRDSGFAHPNWLSGGRITTFLEEAVPPGETATFCFQIWPGPNARCETFQLVVEGRCWLPNTQFEIQLGRVKASLVRLRHKIGRGVAR